MGEIPTTLKEHLRNIKGMPENSQAKTQEHLKNICRKLNEYPRNTKGISKEYRNIFQKYLSNT